MNVLKIFYKNLKSDTVTGKANEYNMGIVSRTKDLSSFFKGITITRDEIYRTYTVSTAPAICIESLESLLRSISKENGSLEQAKTLVKRNAEILPFISNEQELKNDIDLESEKM